MSDDAQISKGQLAVIDTSRPTGLAGVNYAARLRPEYEISAKFLKVFFKSAAYFVVGTGVNYATGLPDAFVDVFNGPTRARIPPFTTHMGLITDIVDMDPFHARVMGGLLNIGIGFFAVQGMRIVITGTWNMTMRAIRERNEGRLRITARPASIPSSVGRIRNSGPDF